MANFGQRPINDTSKDRGGRRAAFRVDGEKRIEIRPTGIVERFVDPSGHIVSPQLSSNGAVNPIATAAAERIKHHALGFVEHGKCPIRSGARFSTAALQLDFDQMPAALQASCGEDPRAVVKTAGGFEWQGGCKHIEWLIEFRKTRAADINANRNADRVDADRRKAELNELQAIQLANAKEQLAASRAKAAPVVEDKAPRK